MIRSRHLLLVLALAMPACVVSGRGSMSVESTTPVVYEEPPPPQQEVITVRPGHVWIKGRYLVVVVSKISAAENPGNIDAAARALVDKAITRL